MGLDTTHDCWHGAYSAFMRWRRAVAKAALIPLDLMDGFYRGAPDEEAMRWAAPADGGPACGRYHGPTLHRWIEDAIMWLPIRWNHYEHDAICVLLNHSDCEGIIAHADCERLANRLEQLLPSLESIDSQEEQFGHVARAGGNAGAARKFIAGLRAAHVAGEDVGFH